MEKKPVPVSEIINETIPSDNLPSKTTNKQQIPIQDVNSSILEPIEKVKSSYVPQKFGLVLQLLY